MSRSTTGNHRTNRGRDARRARPGHETANADADVQALPTCERLWTTVEVAEFLGVPVMTLWQWRHARTGPKAFKVGRHLRYDPDEVRRWLVEECGTEASA